MNSQTLGSTLLVAGTSIGAGMLALPLVSAATGIWSGILLMMLMAALACYGGLLIAEACRAVPEADNLHGVVGRLLGKSGQAVAILAMLFLYYSLCSAYITAGAGQVVSFSHRMGLALSFSQSATLVAVVIAVMVVIGTVVVDYANRTMFFLMMMLLMFIMVLLLPEAEAENLTLGVGEPGMLFAALPVLYTSFGYHCAVPTVVRYVKGRPGDFRLALVLGSVLPLVVYSLWQVATNGTLSSVEINSLHSSPDAVGQLIRKIGDASHYSGFSYLISGFTVCALGTSFLGVAIGLFDYLAEVSQRPDNIMGRIQTVCLTLGLPLLVAVLFPGGFVMTLGYAAVALVILAVFIPVMLVWEARKQDLEEPYQVAGGKLLLVIMCLIGLAVILAQAGIVSGWLPALDS
ncbi:MULTISPECIES: aromatic amino acid transport family protein [unclassified Endozoicomonas]|uniref:aromatic amino acid transport family protein n=1 Tax=unclassified Endozoicomonas TaxID=2644528 RepID=UPI002148C051|nr:MULTISPECIES: aromatic amino acid transport family protein [unclassified Endozoicomonas]